MTVEVTRIFRRVLIVGAGPTGLALAIELGSHRIPCIVVERNDRTGHEPHPEVLAKRMELPEKKVRSMLKVAKQPVSLETPVGEDADATPRDLIEYPMAASPAEAAVHANMRSALDEAFDGLSPREATALRTRFGIDTATDNTLEELGKQFDLTRERVRQIESKAMRKLMHPSRPDKLRQFLER